MTDSNQRTKRPEPIQVRLGTITLSPGAQKVLTTHDVLAALSRHSRGDWGDSRNEQDWADNDLRYHDGYWMESWFYAADQTEFLVLTDPRLGTTTVELVEERYATAMNMSRAR